MGDCFLDLGKSYGIAEMAIFLRVVRVMICPTNLPQVELGGNFLASSFNSGYVVRSLM